jgi:MoxR-like ATPase
VARWYPPEFLPRGGAGVLFLDELNMAPPAVQGIAQQLILDRRVGSYTVPDGWFIWAAGNRREDRAAVFDMPAPLANRFLHLEVEPDFASFRSWAAGAAMDERILAFLGFRPTLLHHPDPARPAWPSPRSWSMANALIQAGLPIEPAVGPAAAGEFTSFGAVFDRLPDIDVILAGSGAPLPFPSEPSARYATSTALALRPETHQQTAAACEWLSAKAPSEWTILFLHLTMDRAKRRGQLGGIANLVREQPGIAKYLATMRDASLGV